MDTARILEAAANVAILTACLWPVHTRIRTLLSSIPRRYALAHFASIGILIGAQAAGESEAYYPLADWGMYTTSYLEDPHFFDYTAELASGREERLLIGRLFPAGGTLFRARIDDAAEAIEKAGSGSVDPATVGKLDSMLAAIAGKHDADHPGDPVRAIHLWSGTMSVGKHGNPSSLSRRLIHEYRVP